MSKTGRKRPWLAVLLALIVSGLGHAYLRRWGRAVGWYALITVTLVFAVPDAAVEQLIAGTTPSAMDLLPALVVVVASVVDAYVLAVRTNDSSEDADRSSVTGDAVDAATTVVGSDGDDDAQSATECPHCGREVDPELDFCHWCTEELPDRESAGAE